MKGNSAVNNDDSTRECPYCAELIKPSARLCKHCKSDLTGSVATPVQFSSKAGPGPSILPIVGVLALVIGAIVWLGSTTRNDKGEPTDVPPATVTDSVTPQVSPTESVATESAPENDTLPINKDCRCGHIVYHIDQMERLRTLGRNRASNASFVVIDFTILNENNSPSDDAREYAFFIRTDDHTTFQEDSHDTLILGINRGIDRIGILQPGIQKPAVAVFEIPDSVWIKHPQLWLVRRSFGMAEYKLSLIDGNVIQDEVRKRTPTAQADESSDQGLKEEDLGKQRESVTNDPGIQSQASQEAPSPADPSQETTQANQQNSE